MSERDEGALPRVPLPGLAESGAKFLRWCAPLVGPDEYARTEAAVTALSAPDGPGPRLQAALETYDADPEVHSWLDVFWGYRHLGGRDRIAGNSNYFYLFDDAPLADDEPQVERAAGLVAAAVNYKLALDDERVHPVTRHGEPLSLQQHKNLFATTRIPGFAEDTLRAPHTDEQPGASTAKHIAVLVRGNIFCLDVFAPDGTAHSIDDLTAGLREIQKRGATPATPDAAVGQLPTRVRSQWAATRQGLLAHSGRNTDALDKVERALLCLCLDDFTATDVEDVCARLLHGDGANRWYDKSVSLIVFADGRAGLNVDRGGLDETTVADFVDTLLGSPPAEHARRAGAASQGPPAAERVEFELDEALRANVRVAGEEFAEYTAGVATATASFDEFGADTAERLGVSPDAFLQLAYQLAHHRARGLLGSTSAWVPTPGYHHGRTELLRVPTPESVRFVAAMDDPETGTTARATAFRTALDAHEQRVRECRTGCAPEQHLAELQRIAQRRGRELDVPTPEVFSSPGWLAMRADYLSTASAPSKNIRFFGFGPPSGQSIALGYVVLPQHCNVHLSAPAAVAEGMHAFRDELATAITQLRELLAAHA